MHKWPDNFDMNTFLTLIGDNDYLEVKEGTESKEIIRDSVNGYYARTKKYVNYIDKLGDMGVSQSDFADIAAGIISMHKDEKEEYTFSFITQLLENVF